MKKFILPVLLISFGLCISSLTLTKKKKKAVKFKLEGTITEVHPHCGGAAPTYDMQFPKPVPKAGIKLFVRKGNFNNPKEKIIDSLVSDAEGKFNISLPAGTYTFIEPWKKEKYQIPQNSKYSTYDTACYRKMYHQPDYTIELKNNTSGIAINFQRYCFWRMPCVQYDGPLPPASNPGRGKVGE